LKHRRIWTWLGLLMAFALVIAACGDDDGEDTTTTGAATTTTAASTTTAATTTTAGTTTTTLPQKPYGGQVIIADDQEPPTLNPWAPGGDNFIVSKIGQGWQCGTQEVSGYTLEIIPDLVTEMPTLENGGLVLNDDGTETVTFQIREEAIWADGTPISGADYEFTLQQILAPENLIDTTYYEDITDYVVGDKTFEFTMAAPTLATETMFGLILPKHDVEGTSLLNDYNTTPWVSCGPFVVDQWAPGEFVKLVRNDNFWKTDPETGQQLPYLDTVIFRFIPETAALINAFKAREVDVINPPPAALGMIEDLQALEPEGASVEVLTGPQWEHMMFQFGDGRLVANPGSYNQYIQYRKAIAHLIDRQKIVDEILFGQVEPMQSFVSAYAPTLSHENWAQYDFNLDTARAYIEELCALEGVDCVANPPKAVLKTTTSREITASLYLEMFAAAGIGYEFILEPSTLYFGDTLEFGLQDLGQWTWIGTPGFAGLAGLMDLWDPKAGPPTGQNYYRYGTPAVTLEEAGGAEGYVQGPSSVIDEHSARYGELVALVRSTINTEEITAYLAEMEAILADQMVFLPLYQRLDPGAVWADTIGGFKHNPSQSALEWNIEEWYRMDLG
jgi:ABC-type transport system substrate-binding protein